MTRWEVIQQLIDKKGFRSFLEIGTFRGETFSQVKCAVKESVDPDPLANATYRMTSDEFFKNYHFRYDIIFIDGLHERNQVWRDILNSITCLNENGVIVMHDCLPENEEMQEWSDHSHQDKAWTGDAWKAYLKSLYSLPYYVYLIDTDYGCGIIDTGARSQVPFRRVNMDALQWKDFDKSIMNIKLEVL